MIHASKLTHNQKENLACSKDMAFDTIKMAKFRKQIVQLSH